MSFYVYTIGHQKCQCTNVCNVMAIPTTEKVSQEDDGFYDSLGNLQDPVSKLDKYAYMGTYFLKTYFKNPFHAPSSGPHFYLGIPDMHSTP